MLFFPLMKEYDSFSSRELTVLLYHYHHIIRACIELYNDYDNDKKNVSQFQKELSKIATFIIDIMLNEFQSEKKQNIFDSVFFLVKDPLYLDHSELLELRKKKLEILDRLSKYLKKESSEGFIPSEHESFLNFFENLVGRLSKKFLSLQSSDFYKFQETVDKAFSYYNIRKIADSSQGNSLLNSGLAFNFEGISYQFGE